MKYIKNDIFENLENSKITPETPKKSHIRRPQIKKFRKETIVRNKKILKITSKHPKAKKLKKSHKEASNKKVQ